METLKRVLPGVYDNENQHFCYELDGRSVDNLHFTVALVETPALSPSVIFFEDAQFIGGTNIFSYGRKLYKVNTYDDGSVHMTFMAIKSEHNNK